MAYYAIRVELKGNPTYQEYQTLHALMARMGFSQTIDGVDTRGNQRAFDLPHAVYYGSSQADVGTVRTSVATAVKAQVQNDIIVFVVQAATWAIG
jgi:hypothetical protein